MKKYEKSFYLGSISLFIFAFGCMSTRYIDNHYVTNNTVSLPQKLFKKIDFANNLTLKKGDFVQVCPTFKRIEPLVKLHVLKQNSSECNHGYPSILKIIGAVEGDYVEASDEEGIKVNNDYLMGTVARSKLTKHFKFKGIVPKNQYLIYTTYTHGYDSRYFGFIDKSEIKYVVEPVF